jgi:hypothetical protein
VPGRFDTRTVSKKFLASQHQKVKRRCPEILVVETLWPAFRGMIFRKMDVSKLENNKVA